MILKVFKSFYVSNFERWDYRLFKNFQNSPFLIFPVHGIFSQVVQTFLQKFFYLTCKLHTFCQTTYNYFSTTCNFYPQKHAFTCFLNPRSTKMSEKFLKNSRRRSPQVRIRLFYETQLHVNLQRLPS